MKTIKRVTAMVLAAVMCVSFSGCGKKKTENKEEVVPYKLTQLMELDQTLDNVIYEDGTIYGSYSKYEEDDFRETHGIIKYELSSGVKNEVNLDIASGYVNHMYIDSDGNLVVKAEKYPEDFDLFQDKMNGTASESSVQQDTVNETQGDEDSSEDAEEDPSEDAEERPLEDDSSSEEADFQVIQVTYVFSPSLEKISSDEIVNGDGEDQDEEWISNAMIDHDGNTIEIVETSDGESGIRLRDAQGNEIKKSKIDDDLYVNDLIQLEDGTVLVSVWGDVGMELYTLDKEECKLGDKYIDNEKLLMVSSIFAGKDNSVLLNMDESLYICDGDSKKMTKVLKYLDNDLLYDNVVFVCAMEEDSYAIVVNDYDHEKSEIDLLSKQNKEDVVQKEEIHLAALGLDDDIKQKVIRFNKTNENYRIVIDEYLDSEAYDSETGYEDAIKRFNADILSSSADIIDLKSIDISQYASKGIIEDLLPYMEKDSDINVDDFVDSIVAAYERDGKLYTLPTYFTLDSFVGATGLVGSETKWTLSEFIEFVKGLPEGMDVLNEVSSDYLLSMMIRCDIDEYVNWDEGTCHFNSEEFINLLELCSNYKTAEELWADYEDYEDEDWENEPSEITKIKNHKLALYDAYISDVDDYLVLQQTFDEGFTIKGYPTKEKNGILILGSGGSLGICSKSKHKDIAWDFVKQMYSYDELSKEKWSFPVRKDALDQYFEEMKNRPLETAEDGTQYYTQWGMNDIELYIGNPTDEDINQMKEMINKADTLMNYSDSDIFSMIEEESESFFKGEKTAKEVADIIQSRVSIYVKENK
ncbi:MAG: extracellular solute-binding protein [Lachnospiraceae bacterium]|nr:extracellular solute-binding protein [Lachnospiraceae bacterium]